VPPGPGAGFDCLPDGTGIARSPRPRARDVGIVIGTLQPGPLNAITDVAGVRVGHATVRSGDSISTGVTAILPPGERWFQERVPAAVVVGNGFGKLLGITQVQELGELETPIALTCTLCVWRVADAMVDWLLGRPGMANVASINPVVSETKGARSGPVEEGAVGALRLRRVRTRGPGRCASGTPPIISTRPHRPLPCPTRSRG